MAVQSVFENCLSGVSEAACVSRIDNYLSLPDLLLAACFFFMGVASIGAVLELSAKRANLSGIIKFGSSLVLTSYLVLVPLSTYSLEVFEATPEAIEKLKNVSWYHHLKELGES